MPAPKQSSAEANPPSAAHLQAREFARLLLEKERTPSAETIKAKVEQAADFAAQTAGGPVDIEALVREFEGVFSVFIADGKALDDMRGHQAWLPDRRGLIRWNFWRRYERYLLQRSSLGIRAIQNLDSVTDQVLERIEDPERQESWDRRGLVVGSVQSGKTGNYTGLICKALDAGYKLIIVLAGMHNSLRSQTQIRIDEGVIGFDTSKHRLFNIENKRVGVGQLVWEFLRINSLTTSEDKGDFSRAVLKNVAVSLGGDPYILVVKKHGGILKNLLEWALHLNGIEDANGRRIIHNVPLLLIDDEADNASINTRAVAHDEDPENYEPSKINRRIREILATFDKSAYVGYTATPFANIFVKPDEEHIDLGDDIFPRSFILNLEPPSNYIGPAKVFGLDGDPDAGIEGIEPLPVVRIVDDQATYFPPKYRKDHDPGGLPASLREAIRAFILVCAARAARGQARVHNSMLIHVARFVNVQHLVRDFVQDELKALQRRIEYEASGSKSGVRLELHKLWETEFVPKTAHLGLDECPSLSWDAVDKQLHPAAAKIGIKEINGEVQDILDYMEHPNGRSVIAIGGDKLSRGLTLDGLSISYYLRMTRMYDTLMQMGRWFGYRPGYLDLCRLYTTQELVDWYRHITLADIELRREFEYMWQAGRTPTDYGLKVRTHPEGLLITALNKSRHSERMLIEFTGKLIQTATLWKTTRQIEDNFKATEELTRKLGKSSTSGKDARVWRDVPVNDVTAYLRRFAAHPHSVEADGSRLGEYIDRQIKFGDLCKWTIALLSSSVAKNHEDIGSEKNVGLTLRREPEIESGGRADPKVYFLRKSNILNPVDQYIDFEGVIVEQEYAKKTAGKSVFEGAQLASDRQLILSSIGKPLVQLALDLSVARWERGVIHGERPSKPNGRIVRELRPDANGLLLLYPLDPMVPKGVECKLPIIGFALSFPASDKAQPIEYLVNEVYQRLNLQGSEDDLDGN